MQRVACGDQPTWRLNEPLKQSGSQWLRENVLRQPSADGFDRSGMHKHPSHGRRVASREDQAGGLCAARSFGKAPLSATADATP
jgi:hypothetical protein